MGLSKEEIEDLQYWRKNFINGLHLSDEEKEKMHASAKSQYDDALVIYKLTLPER